jgi:hypothetical protein
MKDRKYFIDNLRWITVLLLFPFHTFIIYNTFGEENYIKGIGNIYLTNINASFWPWFMPLLFVLAGISSRQNGRILPVMTADSRRVICGLSFICL